MSYKLKANEPFPIKRKETPFMLSCEVHRSNWLDRYWKFLFLVPLLMLSGCQSLQLPPKDILEGHGRSSFFSFFLSLKTDPPPRTNVAVEDDVPFALGDERGWPYALLDVEYVATLDLPSLLSNDRGKPIL